LIKVFKLRIGKRKEKIGKRKENKRSRPARLVFERAMAGRG
jgi:hypothetical protein